MGKVLKGVSKIAGGLLGGGGGAAQQSAAPAAAAPAPANNDAMFNYLAAQEAAKQQAMGQSQAANAQAMQGGVMGLPAQPQQSMMAGAGMGAGIGGDDGYDANAQLSETLKALRGY